MGTWGHCHEHWRWLWRHAWPVTVGSHVGKVRLVIFLFFYLLFFFLVSFYFVLSVVRASNHTQLIDYYIMFFLFLSATPILLSSSMHAQLKSHLWVMHWEKGLFNYILYRYLSLILNIGTRREFVFICLNGIAIGNERISWLGFWPFAVDVIRWAHPDVFLWIPFWVLHSSSMDNLSIRWNSKIWLMLCAMHHQLKNHSSRNTKQKNNYWAEEIMQIARHICAYLEECINNHNILANELSLQLRNNWHMMNEFFGLKMSSSSSHDL